jgi:hypothetical protein
VFFLPSFGAVQEYLHGLGMAEFPRRKVYRYGAEDDEAALVPAWGPVGAASADAP